ncbi:MAG: C1 family peptidase [Armatimonadetes bacterium]|nr:C1 family peptidase [Armatimonadota bacterium]
MPEPTSRPTAIPADALDRMQSAFRSDPRNRAALNAVAKTSVRGIAMNREAVLRARHTYSHVTKAGESTSQNGSGRCWLFAGLNTVRMAAAEKLGLENFELSQNYPMFWDKLEKANYFLESILATLDEPTDGRLIAFLCQAPIQDGGQWDMFVNIVRKYGVVPKEVMPETESSSSTGMLCDRLTLKLRQFAAILRRDHRAGATLDELRARKPAMLDEVYRILAIHLGEPPASFEWQWRDKDKSFHRDGVLTPLEFTEKYCATDLDAMVCLIHCPQQTKQIDTVYTVDYLGNVLEGQIVRYLNVSLDAMKAAAIAMIKDGKSVWFGCDVGKCFDRDLGMMDLELYDYPSIYGTDFALTKAERLDYGESAMNHAMVFSGVDLDDEGKPRKWRVENSWGDKGGEKGFMLMSDAWFDEFNYEVAVEKAYLPAELLAALETEPVHLHPWDPMGALA